MIRAHLVRVAALFFLILAPALSRAQTPSPRDTLLRYVPKDFGLCFVLNDLRGHAAVWEKSPWIQALKESAMGRALIEAPEFKELLKLKQDLHTYLGVDWASLRDDVLGDAVVFGFQPALDGKPQDEQGILLIRPRRPKVLIHLLDNLNKAQKTSGELKTLETLNYEGTSYARRVDPKGAHYYLLSGDFFAYTAQEALLKGIILKRKQENRGAPPLARYLRQAGADDAVLSLAINPRAFDAEVKAKVGNLTGPEAILASAFLKQWQALDAVVCSISLRDILECKLTVLAREGDLPASTRGIFKESTNATELWRRFPDNAILSVVVPVEGKELVDNLLELAPADVRRELASTLQPLAALAGFDVAKDAAASLGPDCGFSVISATDPTKLPQVIAALGVRPGPKSTDQTAFRSVNFLASLAVLDHNRRNPKNIISLQSLQQGNVEVKYLANDSVFPPGFQPAWALKDGYLLLATSPDAIAGFRTAANLTARASNEVPLMRLSATELANALRLHRQSIVDHIATNNQMSKAAAEQRLGEVLSVLDPLSLIEFARIGGAGQAGIVLRVSPAGKN